MINNDYIIEIRNDYIDIKNYINILDYDEKCIYIKFKNISIKLYGKNLIISKMDSYELCIKGNINNIEYIYE